MTQDYGVGLTLPFPDKFHLRGEAARGDLHSAESSLTKLQQQVASQTLEAYDALLVASKHHDDLEEGLNLSRDFLKRTEARFEAGTARLDVIKARVDVAQAENDLIGNERAIANARAGLNRLLGPQPGAPIEATDPLGVPPRPRRSTAWRSSLETRRPELRGLAAPAKRERGAPRALARQYWLPDLTSAWRATTPIGSPRPTRLGIALHVRSSSGSTARARSPRRATASSSWPARRRTRSPRWSRTCARPTRPPTTRCARCSSSGTSCCPRRARRIAIASVSYGLGGSSALEVLDARARCSTRRASMPMRWAPPTTRGPTWSAPSGAADPDAPSGEHDER